MKHAKECALIMHRDHLKLIQYSFFICNFMVIFRNVYFENFSCTLFLWKRRGKKYKYFWPAKNRPQEARISRSLAEVTAVSMQINNDHFEARPPFLWDIFRKFRGLWAYKSKNMPKVLHNSRRKCIWFHVKLQINICAIYRFAPCRLNCHFSSFADLAIFRVLLSTGLIFHRLNSLFGVE